MDAVQPIIKLKSNQKMRRIICA